MAARPDCRPAIRLKQLAAEHQREVSVCVLEKGSEIGAHILSGAVIDPKAINELIPDWQARDAPLKTPVTEDRFMVLGADQAYSIPSWLLPPLMSNHGNYIISLGNLCRWLAQHAESLGVEVYAGFAAAELLCDTPGNGGAVLGVATGDVGVAKDGTHKPDYQPGMELRAKYTLFAEGCRGLAVAGADVEVQPARRHRSAKVRHRHQGAVAGRPGQAPARARAPQPGLAPRQRNRRRIVPVSLRGAARRGGGSSCI